MKLSDREARWFADSRSVPLTCFGFPSDEGDFNVRNLIDQTLRGGPTSVGVMSSVAGLQLKRETRPEEDLSRPIFHFLPEEAQRWNETIAPYYTLMFFSEPGLFGEDFSPGLSLRLQYESKQRSSSALRDVAAVLAELDISMNDVFHMFGRHETVSGNQTFAIYVCLYVNTEKSAES